MQPLSCSVCVCVCVCVWTGCGYVCVMAIQNITLELLTPLDSSAFQNIQHVQRLYLYQIWPTLTVKLWKCMKNSDFTGVRDCPLGTKDRFHSTGLLIKGSLVGSSQPSSKSSLISSLDPVYGNCRALLGTVGGKLYLTCANWLIRIPSAVFARVLLCHSQLNAVPLQVTVYCL